MIRAKLPFALLAMSITLLTAWTLNDQQHFTNVTSTTIMTTADSAKDERDILRDILALNNNKRYAPPSDFRKGHVTETTLKDYLEKTDYGYVVKLPSSTLVPTPAVIAGKVYLSGGFGSKQYYSFDAQTGRLRWAVNLDDDGPSSPAIQDSVIVFNTESCTIFACDLITGRQLWSYYLGDPLMSMPTIANGIVFTAYPASYENAKRDDISITPSHVLIAIELRSGKILWQKWIDSDVMSAPVARGNLLYVTTFSGALYKVKQKTGEIIEAKAIRATSAPVFSSENEVIVSQRDDSKSDSVLREKVVVGSGTTRKEVYKKQADYLDKKVQSNTRLKASAGYMDAGN